MVTESQQELYAGTVHIKAVSQVMVPLQPITAPNAAVAFLSNSSDQGTVNATSQGVVHNVSDVGSDDALTNLMPAASQLYSRSRGPVTGGNKMQGVSQLLAVTDVGDSRSISPSRDHGTKHALTGSQLVSSPTSNNQLREPAPSAINDSIMEAAVGHHCPPDNLHFPQIYHHSMPCSPHISGVSYSSCSNADEGVVCQPPLSSEMSGPCSLHSQDVSGQMPPQRASNHSLKGSEGGFDSCPPSLFLYETSVDGNRIHHVAQLPTLDPSREELVGWPSATQMLPQELEAVELAKAVGLGGLIVGQEYAPGMGREMQPVRPASKHQGSTPFKEAANNFANLDEGRCAPSDSSFHPSAYRSPSPCHTCYAAPQYSQPTSPRLYQAEKQQPQSPSILARGTSGGRGSVRGQRFGIVNASYCGIVATSNTHSSMVRMAPAPLYNSPVLRAAISGAARSRSQVRAAGGKHQTQSGYRPASSPEKHVALPPISAESNCWYQNSFHIDGQMPAYIQPGPELATAFPPSDAAMILAKYTHMPMVTQMRRTGAWPRF